MITTLSVDIGGTHVKASVLDERGRMLHERVRIDTPNDLTPRKLVSIIARLAEQLPRFHRISAGFPGVVRRGVVRTAPNLGTERFAGFKLASALEKRLGAPARACNDADMQGYGVIRGRGVEMVITLGTGFGSALFEDGRLGPHLELAHHIFHGKSTYEDELGDSVLKKRGRRRWNRELRRAIDALRSLTMFDHLYIGGGNSRNVRLELADDVSIVDNAAGILGGVRLWKFES